MVRELLPLERYIEDFCSRLDRNAAFITNAEKDGSTEGNWFQHLAASWRAIKNQYLNELALKGVLAPQTQTQTQTQARGMQQREMIAEEMMTDEMGFNAAFLVDFWAVDFIPPWYGAVPLGSANPHVAQAMLNG